MRSERKRWRDSVDRAIGKSYAVLVETGLLLVMLGRADLAAGRYRGSDLVLGSRTPLDDHGRDLLEILDDRQGRGSTIVTSQIDVKHWHEMIANPTVADAILDRLVHSAHRLNASSTFSVGCSGYLNGRSVA